MKLKEKRCGLGKALSLLGIKTTGTAHRALDDVKSIYDVFKILKDTTNA